MRGEGAGWRRWRDAALEHIFRRPRKPKPLFLGASLLLFFMALGSLVMGIREVPLMVGEEVVATGLEALCYRIGAALLSGALGGWLLARSLPPKSEAERLTR